MQRHLLHDFGTENFQGSEIRLVLAGFLRHELVFDLNADDDPLQALTAAISQVDDVVFCCVALLLRERLPLTCSQRARVRTRTLPFQQAHAIAHRVNASIV